VYWVYAAFFVKTFLTLFRQWQNNLKYFLCRKTWSYVPYLHHSTYVVYSSFWCAILLCNLPGLEKIDERWYMKLFSKGAANSSRWHYVYVQYTLQHDFIYRPTTQAVWELLMADESSQKSTEKTHYWKFETNIPRKGTVRPQSQFLHSCFCERFIYSHHRSVYSAAGKYVDRSWEYINRSRTHECVTWDWGSAIPFLGKHKWDFRCSAKSQSIPHVYQSYDDEIICTKTTETFRLFF
jgi:hypothetical protein